MQGVGFEKEVMLLDMRTVFAVEPATLAILAMCSTSGLLVEQT